MILAYRTPIRPANPRNGSELLTPAQMSWMQCEKGRERVAAIGCVLMEAVLLLEAGSIPAALTEIKEALRFYSQYGDAW